MRDRRGLSTLEFAVLFVVIIVGALALWHALGRSLESQLGRAQSAFDSELAHAEQNSRAAGIERSQAAASGPASGAKPSASPPSAASGPAGGAKPSALPPSAASGPASVAKSSGSPPSAANDPASVAKPSGSPPAPATSGPAAVTRAGGASPGLFDRQLGTGGKIAVAAGGALAGAAVAAGASVLTTYAATALCGPAALVCAGAVTGYLAYQGGKALYNGGWNQLKGAFSAIRFQSMRDTSGSNIVVLKDFEIILKPVMITPIQ